MQYVKLTARPDTWFKTGSEVYHDDGDRRLTVAEWESALKDRGFWARGIRVCEDNPNERGNGWPPGFEREDGEWCSPDEFDVETVEEAK